MVGSVMTVVTCFLGFLALSWYLSGRLFFVIAVIAVIGVIVSSSFLFILTHFDLCYEIIGWSDWLSEGLHLAKAKTSLQMSQSVRVFSQQRSVGSIFFWFSFSTKARRWCRWCSEILKETEEKLKTLKLLELISVNYFSQLRTNPKKSDLVLSSTQRTTY